MDERNAYRAEIMSQVTQGMVSVNEAAKLLALSRKQIQRLLKTYRGSGPLAMQHKAVGRPSNNRIEPAVRTIALKLVEEKYAHFGPTQAAEKLTQEHGLKVSRETLRKWMKDAGIGLSPKQRHAFHQSRTRREYYGELIHVDSVQHTWCCDRQQPCRLLFFMDDATGKLMHAEFVTAENIFSYFRILEYYLQTHGRPIAFCGSNRAVFRAARQVTRSRQDTKQFRRALRDLDIELNFANTGMKKDRVARVAPVIYDDLLKELRLAGIRQIAAGNAFLPGFIRKFNERFATSARQPDDLHRSTKLEPDRLRTILCVRNKRYVNARHIFSYERYRIKLDKNDLSQELAGKHIDTYEYEDGTLDFRWEGILLSYWKFDLVQHITNASINENAHLSSVLTHIRAEHGKASAKKNQN